MARLTAVLALAAVTLTGCAAAPDEAPATVTETTTVTEAPEPEVTRNEAAFLHQLSNYDEWDTDTKLAIGHQLCDELEAGTPVEELSVEEYISGFSEAGLGTNLGLAVRNLCPDAIPEG